MITKISQISRFFQDRRNKMRARWNENSHGGLANSTWDNNIVDWRCDVCGLSWTKRKEFSCAVYRHINIEPNSND